MTLADPSRNWIPIADFSVQAFLGLPYGSTNPRIHITYQLSHLIHVSWLKPRFLNIFGVFMRYNPVELVTIARCVLDEMDVVADPNIDTFFFNKFSTKRIFFQIGSLEIGPEASIA